MVFCDDCADTVVGTTVARVGEGMNRLALRYLPPLLYMVFGFAVVWYAYDTTKIVDFSLAVNQLGLDEARRICGGTPLPFERVDAVRGDELWLTLQPMAIGDH